MSWTWYEIVIVSNIDICKVLFLVFNVLFLEFTFSLFICLFYSHILAIDLFVLIFTDAFKFIKRMQGLAEHSPTWQSHHYGPISTSKSLLCSPLCILKRSLMWISDWPFSIQMEGFQEFEARRKMKFDKQIDSNVIISSKGLDEGVDLWYTNTAVNFVSPFTPVFRRKLIP